MTMELECLSIQAPSGVPTTFKEEDVLIGDMKHNRLLYFTGYIQEVNVLRIQLDPGSSVNIMLARIMTMIDIPISALMETNVNIQGYNVRGDRVIGKVRVKCQLRDMTSCLTCYFVEVSATYGLLLGRARIHENNVVASILHQYFEDVGEDLKVHSHFDDKNPFQAIESHDVDANLYNTRKDNMDDVAKKNKKGIVLEK